MRQQICRDALRRWSSGECVAKMPPAAVKERAALSALSQVKARREGVEEMVSLKERPVQKCVKE